MVLASSMPEVTVKDLLQVLLRAEQMMVHLQKLWKNDNQRRRTYQLVQLRCQALKKLLLFCSLLVFSFSIASVSSTESTILAELYFNCGRKKIKTNLKSIFEVHGLKICHFSENVLISCGVVIKLFIV